MAQYRPYSGGSPASVANATPWGSTTIAPIRPASASALSVAASTRGHHFSRGNSRSERGEFEGGEGVTGVPAPSGYGIKRLVSNVSGRPSPRARVLSFPAFLAELPHARSAQVRSRVDAGVREPDSHALARYAPQLRVVSPADEHGERLGAGSVRLRGSDAEPALGRDSAVHRDARRPVRGEARALRGRAAVRARPGIHGE